MTDYSVHIVIDIGTHSCKAGFNGENAPRVVIPTVIGKSKNEYINFLEDTNKLYFGREAIHNANFLKCRILSISKSNHSDQIISVSKKLSNDPIRDDLIIKRNKTLRIKTNYST